MHHLTLRELGAEQVCDILKASLVIHANALKENDIWELLFNMFRNLDYSVSSPIGARLLKVFVASNSQGKAQMPSRVSIPIAFEPQL